MNLNSYFHIGDINKPLDLEAASPDEVSRSIGKQYSKRLNPNYTWMRAMFGGEYNPDELDYTVYDEMMKDPQIRSCIRFIDTARLNKDFIITPASDDPADIEVADFVREVIDNMRTPMRMVRKSLYSALQYGYAVSEINYAAREMDGKMRIVWDRIQPLHIATIQDCFQYNEDGTVKTIWQNTQYDPFIEIPAWKCIINTFDEVFGNKYGQSALRSIYNNHFMKSQILKWYATYLYKLEGPAVIGKSGNKEAMLGVLNDIKEGTLTGVVDPDDEIQLIESQHRGEGFISAINYHDHMIAINFMIGSLLLGQAENQSGSYAQSQTHLDVAMIFLDGLHEDDAIPWQEQIKTLVDLNFTVDKYPKFSFEKFTQNDLLGLLAALQPYAQNFILSTDELGLRQLIKQILKEHADIELEEDGTIPMTPTQEASALTVPEQKMPTETMPTAVQSLTNNFP